MRVFAWALSASLLAPPLTALAEGDDPPLADIDVGSRRIGGPGLTAKEQAVTDWENSPDEDDSALTEETLPPKGNKKRLPGLHKIAGRYFRGQMWREACDRYDQILEEEGEPGLDTDPKARAQASRSFLECGDAAYHRGERDKAETLLKKSEKYGPSDYRHSAIRRQMKRDTYRDEMQKGNVEKALVAFRAYQAEKADEDERIWLGEELSKIAWAAYRAKDEVGMKRAIADAESVAPMNTELRRLKDKLADEGAVIGNIVKWVAAGLLLVGALSLIGRWRGRQSVLAADAAVSGGKSALRLGGKKNKYLDDDE
jgi:tetratricopeptide (TPR) repeat protein